MKKLNSFIIIIMMFYACTESKTPLSTPQAKQYFVGTEVLHYTSNNPRELDSLFFTGSDPNIGDLYRYDFPTSLNDPEFDSLLQCFYTGKELSKPIVDSLHILFSEKRDSFDMNELLTNCLPSYNDILVFKSNNQVTGIAKLCFTCDHYSFTGNKIPPTYFGLPEHYKQLKSLLNIKERMQSSIIKFTPPEIKPDEKPH